MKVLLQESEDARMRRQLFREVLRDGPISVEWYLAHKMIFPDGEYPRWCELVGLMYKIETNLPHCKFITFYEPQRLEEDL